MHHLNKIAGSHSPLNKIINAYNLDKKYCVRIDSTFLATILYDLTFDLEYIGQCYVNYLDWNFPLSNHITENYENTFCC